MAFGSSSFLFRQPKTPPSLARPKRSQRKYQGRKSSRLSIESLESRALMAADLLQLDQSQYATDHFLVQFREGTSTAAALSTAVAGAKITRQVSQDGWYQATITAGGNLTSSLQAFQSLSTVATATPDFRVRLQATPNDTSYASQWALENGNDADIDATQAWSYGTSSSVVVAVIDTGIDYNHVDLATNIWTNTREIAGNGVDDDRNGYTDDVRGWNFVNNTNNPMDDNGHGTHVAGTIGAVGNNGLGISGIAWSVKVMALKFMDATGSGMLSDAVAAIDYARVNGAKIINASWGGGGFTSALQSAITRFQNAGGIFVAAAGNEGANNATTASYPANYSGVISVAASTSTDTLASFFQLWNQRGYRRAWSEHFEHDSGQPLCQLQRHIHGVTSRRRCAGAAVGTITFANSHSTGEPGHE